MRNKFRLYTDILERSRVKSRKVIPPYCLENSYRPTRSVAPHLTVVGKRPPIEVPW